VICLEDMMMDSRVGDEGVIEGEKGLTEDFEGHSFVHDVPVKAILDTREVEPAHAGH
jgi:hypothetical protein